MGSRGVGVFVAGRAGVREGVGVNEGVLVGDVVEVTILVTWIRVGAGGVERAQPARNESARRRIRTLENNLITLSPKHELCHRCRAPGAGAHRG